MNQIHGWSNSMVLLCCVLSFLTLPTNAINLSQNNEKHIRINNHKTTEYASQKLNDLLNNKKRRVKRQMQTSLQLQLAQALQQNPGIAQQLQQNPELLANLRKKLADVYSLHNTQNQQQKQNVQNQRIPKVQRGHFNRQNGFLTADRITPTSTQLIKPKGGGQCNNLRKQNKLLRQMLLSETNDDILDEVPVDEDPFQFDASQIHLSKLSPPNALLNQLQVEKAPSVSLRSSLVTPSATWTTLHSTTSYETVVVHTDSTEVPILWRGSMRLTTVLNSETLTVTATEIKTSSTLVTPTPTWHTETVTITPSAITPPENFFNHPIVRQQHLRQKKAPQLRDATVIEIEKTTTRAQLVSKNDRLRKLYGAFFSDSAQRSKERFGNTFRRNVSPVSTPRKVNSFEEDLEDYDYIDEFDQQVQADRNRPVFVRKPETHNEPNLKVFTLFFSGRVPGEYTTKLTTLPVGPDGQPINQDRKKRDIEDDINPSKVEPILKTESPSVPEAEQWMENGIIYIDSLLDELFELNELQSSLNTPSPITTTVTLTETLIKTETLCNSR